MPLFNPTKNLDFLMNYFITFGIICGGVAKGTIEGVNLPLQSTSTSRIDDSLSTFQFLLGHFQIVVQLNFAKLHIPAS